MTLAYTAVKTVTLINGVSSKLVVSSIELCVSAANAALRALGPSQRPITANPLVKDELEAMDIEAKLQTVHALILTIQKARNNQTEPLDEADVVGVCLGQVRDVLESLTLTLNALNQELEEHEQRWFSSWRTPSTLPLVVTIRSKMLILDKRVDMLLKVKTFVFENEHQDHRTF